MMRTVRIASHVVLAAILLLYGSVAAQDKNSGKKELKIEESAFCTGVKNREPQGVSEVFPADVGRVYLWTTVTCAERPTKIKHVWYYGVKKMREVTLDIEYKRTRTWSYKNMLPQWAGDWHVEVLDENDKVLGRLSFRITDVPSE